MSGHAGDDVRLRRSRVDRGSAYAPQAEPHAGSISTPGRATRSAGRGFAAPETAAEGALRVAVGAAAQIGRWASELAAALAAGDYGRSGQLSFEIRSRARRAENGLAALERDMPRVTAGLSDELAAAREQLAARVREIEPLLRAAPVLEVPNAGSAASEAAWRAARRPETSRWTSDATAMAESLGLAAVDVRSDDLARTITEAKGARGIALGQTVYLHPERVAPGTRDGREVLAHELVHIAQARLATPAGAEPSGGRQAAEVEAATLAPLIASGGRATPRRAIDLSRPAADQDATDTPAVDARDRLAAALAQQIVAAQNWIETTRILVGTTPARVDLARKHAIDLKHVLASMGRATKQAESRLADLVGGQSARGRLDYRSEIEATSALKARALEVRRSAEATIARTYAKDAVQGVHLYLQVRDALAGKADGALAAALAGPGTAGPYTLHAHVKGNRLVYYVAYHTQRKQNEWVVGPDDADAFAASSSLYAGAARLALPGSEHVAQSQADGAIGGHIPSMLELEARQEAPYQQRGAVAFVKEGLDLTNGGSSLNAARNVHVRLAFYVQEAKRVADQMLAKVQSGEMGHIAARDAAVEGRNAAMREARRRMSPAARATSRAIKSDDGRSIAAMVDHKTTSLIREATQHPSIHAALEADSAEWEKYIELEKADAATPNSYRQAVEELGARPIVSKAIIESAGKSNRFITQTLRYFVRPGSAGLGAYGAIDMVRDIASAEDGRRLHVAARELGGFAGGIVGGEVGAASAIWIASLIVTSSAVLLVVSLLGGFIGSVVGAQVGGVFHELPGLAARGPGLVVKAAMPVNASIAGGGLAGMMDRQRRKNGRSGAARKLEERIFAIDEQVRALELSIAEARDRRSLEALQVKRLTILDGRAAYDRLLLALRTKEIDEQQLFEIVKENDL